MKIIVFGGSFDPPHIGHKNLLLGAMRLSDCDKALIIPAAKAPHKKNAPQLGYNQRVCLLREMFLGCSDIEICDIEQDDIEGYTVNTLDKLRKIYPDDCLYLLIGSDMFLSIETWRDYQKILSTTNIITAARKQNEADMLKVHKQQLIQKYPCKGIDIYELDVLDISSSMLRSETVQRICEHNEKYLTANRLEHVKKSADYAVYLACRHGIDVQKAYIAALAHDCTKYLDEQQQREYLTHHNINLTEDENFCPKIFHQISGAHFAEYSLGIKDIDILMAIRYHTTARPAMSPLEKLVFITDIAEPDRVFNGVEKIRNAAKHSLDEALFIALEIQIVSIMNRRLYINLQTINARNYLLHQSI